MPMSFNSGREEISHSGAGATATTASTPTVTNKPDINAFTTSLTQSVPTQSHGKFTSPRKLFFDDLLIPSLKFASAKTNQNNYTPFDHLVNCRNGSNNNINNNININITSNNNRNNYNYKFSSLDSNHINNLFRSDAGEISTTNTSVVPSDSRRAHTAPASPSHYNGQQPQGSPTGSLLLPLPSGKSMEQVGSSPTETARIKQIPDLKLPSLKYLKLLPTRTTLSGEFSAMYPDTSEQTPLWRSNLLQWCKRENYDDYLTITNQVSDTGTRSMGAQQRYHQRHQLSQEPHIPSILEYNDVFQNFYVTPESSPGSSLRNSDNSPGGMGHTNGKPSNNGSPPNAGLGIPVTPPMSPTRPVTKLANGNKKSRKRQRRQYDGDDKGDVTEEEDQGEEEEREGEERASNSDNSTSASTSATVYNAATAVPSTLQFTPYISDKLIRFVRKEKWGIDDIRSSIATNSSNGVNSVTGNGNSGGNHKKTNSFKALQIKMLLDNRDVLSKTSKRVTKRRVNIKIHDANGNNIGSNESHHQQQQQVRDVPTSTPTTRTTSSRARISAKASLTTGDSSSNNDDSTSRGSSPSLTHVLLQPGQKVSSSPATSDPSSSASSSSSSPKKRRKLAASSPVSSRSSSAQNRTTDKTSFQPKYHKFPIDSPPQSPPSLLPTHTTKHSTKRRRSSTSTTARNHNNTNHHHTVRVCLSCKSSDSPCWRPSWSKRKQDQLCNSCGLRYKKTHTRCLNENCKKIPTKGELNVMKSNGLERDYVADVGEYRVGYRCLFCNSITETVF